MPNNPEPPNPGSDAAVSLGCICPVMDNNRGLYVPWPGGFWVNEGCPLHAPERPDE
jgi:hypothetical protein